MNTLIKETVRVTENVASDLDPEVRQVTLQIERDPMGVDDPNYLDSMPMGLVILFVSDRKMIAALQLGNACQLQLTPVADE